MQKSAHLYHYKMQKERLVAVEAKRGGQGSGLLSDSAADSELEDATPSRMRQGAGVEAGGDDNTVYEYPGLASGANMEVVNPVYRGPHLSPVASQSITGGQSPQLIVSGSGQYGAGAPPRTGPARPQ